MTLQEEKLAKRAYKNYLRRRGELHQDSNLYSTILCGATPEQRTDIQACRSEFTQVSFCIPGSENGLGDYGQCGSWRHGDAVCPHVLKIPNWQLFANKELWRMVKKFKTQTRIAHNTNARKIQKIEEKFAKPALQKLESKRTEIVALLKKELVPSL